MEGGRGREAEIASRDPEGSVTTRNEGANRHSERVTRIHTALGVCWRFRQVRGIYATTRTSH
jgi:hypothetical protein